MTRKPTFNVSYAPEDAPIIEWLENKAKAAQQKARASGLPVKGKVDRAHEIMKILRRAYRAEVAAGVSPVASPPASATSEHNPPKATPRPAKRSTRTR